MTETEKMVLHEKLNQNRTRRIVRNEFIPVMEMIVGGDFRERCPDL
jgi:hypothetical protein